jgi:hypothetical protein
MNTDGSEAGEPELTTRYSSGVDQWLGRMALRNGVVVSACGSPMNSTHFVRIDRDLPGGGRHYVVHTADPRLTLELTPDRDAPNRLGRGIIKRVCVPNSWAGDYGQYAKLLTAAQEFFAESHPPAARG